MKNSEPAGEAGERLFFHGSSCGLLLYVVMCLGRSLPFQSVISPVVRRVNITGNRIRVVAQQVLLARSGPEEAAMRCLFPAGAGPARVGCGNSDPVSGPDCVGRPVGEDSWESSPGAVTSRPGRGDGRRTGPVRVGPRAGGVSRTKGLPRGPGRGELLPVPIHIRVQAGQVRRVSVPRAHMGFVRTGDLMCDQPGARASGVIHPPGGVLPSRFRRSGPRATAQDCGHVLLFVLNCLPASGPG